jgi:catechol 2,3-dioxygenase-like lactoylglutathione lyase family enzyme
MDSTTQAMSFVATAKPTEAMAFYRDVLGLELTDDGPFALELRTGGRLLRVQKVAAVHPAPNTALGWIVTDIQAEIASLSAKGVRFSRFDSLDQDDAGIWTSPAGHRIAWFTDPDGNNLSLTEFID